MDVTGNDFTLALMAKSLGLLKSRQEAISGNIANVNTPGYRRRDVDFAGILAEAMDSTESQPKSERINALEAAEPEVSIDRTFLFRNDAGDVDIDREMAEQARTQLLYNAYTRLISKRLKLYLTIITEGRGA
jgi:flagellar basal-body rod protein FlgB